MRMHLMFSSCSLRSHPLCVGMKGLMCRYPLSHHGDGGFVSDSTSALPEKRMLLTALRFVEITQITVSDTRKQSAARFKIIIKHERGAKEEFETGEGGSTAECGS